MLNLCSNHGKSLTHKQYKLIPAKRINTADAFLFGANPVMLKLFKQNVCQPQMIEDLCTQALQRLLKLL